MKKKAQEPVRSISNRRLYFPVFFVMGMGVLIVGAAVWLQIKHAGEQSWLGPLQVLIFGLLLIGVSILMLRWIQREQRREVMKQEWLKTLPRIPKLGKGKLPPAETFRLYDVEKKTLLGTLERPQLQTLIDAYKGWGIGENDFLLLDETIEALSKKSCDPELLAFLKKVLGRRDTVEMRWTSDPESDPAPNKG